MDAKNVIKYKDAHYVGIAVIHFIIFTPHAQRERGKVIGIGVHIIMFICLWEKKLNRTLAIDSPFKLRGRTTRRIYRLALPLISLETLSLLSS